MGGGLFEDHGDQFAPTTEWLVMVGVIEFKPSVEKVAHVCDNCTTVECENRLRRLFEASDAAAAVVKSTEIARNACILERFRGVGDLFDGFDLHDDSDNGADRLRESLDNPDYRLVVLISLAAVEIFQRIVVIVIRETPEETETIESADCQTDAEQKSGRSNSLNHRLTVQDAWHKRSIVGE